jgi:predicted ABC-type ATPase
MNFEDFKKIHTKILDSFPECLSKVNLEDVFKDLQKLIIENHLKEPNPRLNSGQKPKIIFMVGGSGSGKSSCLKKVKENPNFVDVENWITINPDPINEEVYHKSDECRKATNNANDYFFELAKRYKRDIIYDATGRLYTDYQSKIAGAMLDGYDISICAVLIETEIALSRVYNRIRNEGSSGTLSEDGTKLSDFEENRISGTHSQVRDVISQYILIPSSIVSNVFIFDNSGNEPKLILQRDSNGHFTCYNKDAVAHWISDAVDFICEKGNKFDDEDDTTQGSFSYPSSQDSFFGGNKFKRTRKYKKNHKSKKNRKPKRSKKSKRK